jgi:hypothetical protein
VGRQGPRRLGRVAADRAHPGRTEGLTPARRRGVESSQETRPAILDQSCTNPLSPPEPPGFAPAPPAKCGRCGSSRSG